MLALLGGLLSSVMSGGATGLLGILIQRFFDAKSKSQDIEVIALNHKNALDLKEMEIKTVAREWEGREAVAQREAEGVAAQAQADEHAREVEADSANYGRSIDNDKATYSAPDAQKKNKWLAMMMGSVDFIRGITRPALTMYLVVLTHIMFNWARQIAAEKGVTLTAVEVKEIIMTIITTLLYLATVAVVWWFGTRPPARSSAK